jgi:protocatechuate 3,4-dioxygenase beta subunit
MTTKKNRKNMINRRESLRLLGAAGATALVAGGSKNMKGLWPAARLTAPAQAAGVLPNFHGVINSALFASTPLPMVRSAETLACVARPALTEGPYFVDEKLNRSDIRIDPSTNTVSAGVPLKLKFTVNNVSGSACSPVAGAWVDIWHCDAAGAYSDIANGAGQANTSGKKYLRGYQVTDASGAVEFTTIYPGWYSGRSVHIHYKVRLFSGSTKSYEFTSQVFFDDILTDQVFTQAPYNNRGARNTRNSNDGIYQSGGTSTLLSVTSDGAGGYTSTYDIGVTGVPNAVATVATVSAATFASGGSVAAEGMPEQAKSNEGQTG